LSSRTTCERFAPTLEAYVAGEFDTVDLGPLLVHCQGCSDCRRLLELHRDLADLTARAPEPGAAAFDAMHARVLRRIRPAPLATPFRIAAALAAATLLFVAGLGAGRLMPGDPGPPPSGTSGDMAQRILGAIGAEAASNRNLADIEDSRFTYSNVSFRRVDGDRVALDFDLTTHVQLVESAQSDIAREVLVHALLDPSSIGSRLKAMTYAADAAEPKVIQALILALRHDDSLAVRLGALALLTDHLDAPEVESAVLATLRDDESVQMRLLALDSLAGHSVDRERIRQVIETVERPDDAALLVRLTEYDKRL